jgi:hypothetical protein
MVEPDSPLTCPICHEPIQLGAPVLFSAVFGTPRAVHLDCGGRAYRKRSAGDPPGAKKAKDPPADDDRRREDERPREAGSSRG